MAVITHAYSIHTSAVIVASTVSRTVDPCPADITDALVVWWTAAMAMLTVMITSGIDEKFEHFNINLLVLGVQKFCQANLAA